MAGKFFRFGYFSHGANAHAAWKPHDLRDAEAFAFIADVLASTKGGLRYGGPILNHPPPEKVLIEQLGASPNQPPSDASRSKSPSGRRTTWWYSRPGPP